MADRLLFSKTGRAKYISHLDLMRTFQRAFARAHIQIKHTEGFNPHPFVSIALPLSVGYSSQCEILEFTLLGGASPEEVPERLTAAMPEGIVVHQCYPAQRKLKELAYINYIMNFEYPEGRPQEAEPAMRELLSRESLVVHKKSNKSKQGYTEVDLISLIRGWNLECQSDTMTLDAVLCAQNPGLNPELIRATFCECYPQFSPDFVTFHRRDVLDQEGHPFR
ncbi:TIGR03936 family radical SAM-associated protein [Flavonifractor sp. An100]|uniref:TIGR03936 family radical SAM-associated protein n=1 Tax=Flavonifractor sp. An100 TaxID=1965538 RepID=UPI000B394C7B|nr:TIGR03936 family radical SAM-associated protein [Flavonifractor sp. An100]OUQ80133.1 radical SAM protein [Flavonifractor sp. An100]